MTQPRQTPRVLRSSPARDRAASRAQVQARNAQDLAGISAPPRSVSPNSVPPRAAAMARALPAPTILLVNLLIAGLTVLLLRLL